MKNAGIERRENDTFGLAATTFIALLWLPAMLSLYESAHAAMLRLRTLGTQGGHGLP